MTTSILVTVLSLLVACGGGATAYPMTPIADPIPMVENPPEPARPVEAVVVAVSEPAPVVTPPDPEPAHVHPPATVTPAPPVKPKKKKPAPPVAPIRLEIVVTRAGFEPKNVTVPRGKPVILRFERRVERSCGTEVVMVVDGQRIVRDLPLNTPVDLALTFGTVGVVKYACAMDMIRGTVTVQ